MIEYECGCRSKGLLVLEYSPTMFVAVNEWERTDKKLCFDCWWRKKMIPTMDETRNPTPIVPDFDDGDFP